MDSYVQKVDKLLKEEGISIITMLLGDTVAASKQVNKNLERKGVI